ncbi:hypothetical protein HGRIS_005633 [Hohenbuehelia grisea]|uniref:CFEM domain-containing protein n=1 Tax=Hohenbuehelia grisea TaxID=104357 RepID=A0ABR3JXM6_9AGAR
MPLPFALRDVFATAAVMIPLFASVARAQDGDFALCAVTCTLAAAMFAGCDYGNQYCFCTSERALFAAEMCQKTTCGPADGAIAAAGLKALCSIVSPSGTTTPGSGPSIASRPMTVTKIITTTVTSASRSRRIPASSSKTTHSHSRETGAFTMANIPNPSAAARGGTATLHAPHPTSRPAAGSSTLTITPTSTTTTSIFQPPKGVPPTVPIISAARPATSTVSIWSLILPLFLAIALAGLL